MKYPYTMNYLPYDDETFWVAKSTVLKGCIGQGKTQEEALQELSVNEDAWLSAAEETGIPVPELSEKSEFSGKVMLRFPVSEHRLAAMLAKRDGISLNQYITNAIVRANTLAMEQ